MNVEGTERFPVVTIVLLGVVLIEALGLALLRVAVVPSYAKMFSEFGGTLPVLTRLILGTGWTIAWISLLVVSLAISLAVRRGMRRGLLVAAAIAGVIAVILTWAGLYLPIFVLTSTLQ